jgi:hypothetical protein
VGIARFARSWKKFKEVKAVDEEHQRWAIVGVRFIEFVSVTVLVFGLMWKGSDVLKLSLPDFMILYGAVGAVISELTARLLGRKSGKFPEKGKRR